jgi:hypothetical protein
MCLSLYKVFYVERFVNVDAGTWSFALFRNGKWLSDNCLRGIGDVHFSRRARIRT